MLERGTAHCIAQFDADNHELALLHPIPRRMMFAADDAS
jgi:hypothetical protein